MAVLSTKFRLIDDMSDKLSNLGTNGQNVKKELENIGTAASSLDTVSTNAEKASEVMTATADVVKEYQDWHKNSLDALTNYIDGVDGAEETLNKYIGKTEEAQRETENLDETLKGTQKEHEKTQEETEKTSEKTEDYGKTNREVFESLNNLVAAAGIVTFLKQVYDGYHKCIEAASEYETSMAKVSTLADPNQMSVGDMSNEMLELSQQTGQAATELAEAEYQALSAGVATKNAAEFVEQANKLAVGGFTEQATSVDILTTALNAYQLDVSETNRISDILINTQNKGKTTVDELAQNMGRVIPSAAAYNVEIEDLSTAYAILTANGIATAESTTYLKGVFNELGDTGSTVSATLQEETGKSFAQLKDEGNSLGDIIGILSDSVNGNATAFANLWSSQEAGVGALSLMTSGTEKYNATLESMKNSTGTATEAYEKMTNTTEYTAKAVKTAGTNFQIAIGNAMIPATNKFNTAWANVLNGLTTFVNQNPAVVKAVTAGTVGVAAATTAITLYSFKEQIATVATLALKAAHDALSGPIGVVIGLVAAGATALAAWAMSTDDASANAEQLTVASQEQADAVEAANAKYQEAAELYGEDYFLTKQYKDELDELTVSFEKNKETIGDLVAKNEELAQKHQELISNDDTDKIANQASATKGLVDRLSELGSQTNRTASEKAEMLTIIENLNEAFPDLSLNYDDVINKTADTKEALLDLVDKEYDNQQLENAKQGYIDTKAVLEEQQEVFDKMNAELGDKNDLESPYGKWINSDGNAQAQAEWEDFWNAQETVTDENGEEIKKTWGEVYEESAERLAELQKKVDDYGDKIAELEGITDDGAESTLSASEAAIKAAEGVQGQLDNLVAAYDETYQAALESFQNQFALWEEAPEISATSTSTLMSNLDSQITYWQNYADNLENLQNRNIEGLNELIASMDDGSEESAAVLAGMASASNEELEKIVGKYTDLQSEQDKSAHSVAELQEDFSGKVNQMADDMKSAVDNMELSSEASAAAKATIDSYVAQIRNGVSDAGGAAAAVKAAVEKELGTSLSGLGSNITLPGKGYASGTLNAEPGFALVGEEGPELINFGGGEVVYTAGETKQILSQNFNVPDPYASISTSGKTDVPVNASGGSDRTITIKFEGGGSITVGENGTILKEQIVGIMYEQMKPVLIGIVKDEIYEEGDDSYEY